MCVVYGSKDSSIQCLKKNGIAAHAESRILPLIGEMLAAPDSDGNDPFLTSDDDEDE